MIPDYAVNLEFNVFSIKFLVADLILLFDFASKVKQLQTQEAQLSGDTGQASISRIMTMAVGGYDVYFGKPKR